LQEELREIGVYCELVPYDVSSHFIENFNPSGIILSGGPDSVNEEKSARAPKLYLILKFQF
jgi:GMP synthase (glutamine-hydrolysing)